MHKTVLNLLNVIGSVTPGLQLRQPWEARQVLPDAYRQESGLVLLPASKKYTQELADRLLGECLEAYPYGS